MKTAPLDRRRSPRYRPGDHGIVSARVRPGRDVSVIDVSGRGALVECAHRLAPGAPVEFHMRRESGPTEAVRGRVVRCAVTQVRSDAVLYRGAIAFDRQITWLPSEFEGYAVPASNGRADVAVRADATQSVGASALAALRARFL
jgi:hypothetical protein